MTSSNNSRYQDAVNEVEALVSLETITSFCDLAMEIPGIIGLLCWLGLTQFVQRNMPEGQEWTPEREAKLNNAIASFMAVEPSYEALKDEERAGCALLCITRCPDDWHLLYHISIRLGFMEIESRRVDFDQIGVEETTERVLLQKHLNDYRELRANAS